MDYRKKQLGKPPEMMDYTMQKPQNPYVSAYKPQIDSILGNIQNRKPFQFDVNGDAVFQSLKDQAIVGGQRAMADTMAKATATTGGMNNSYSQAVAQQAYNGYLQDLNAHIPALARAAQDRYDAEGRDMKDMLGLYMGMDDRDYGRHRDQVGDDRWQQQFNYSMQQDQADREFRQAEADRQQANWQAQFDYGKAQDAQQQANWEKQWAASQSGGSGGGGGSRGSGGGGGRGSGSGSGTDNNVGTNNGYERDPNSYNPDDFRGFIGEEGQEMPPELAATVVGPVRLPPQQAEGVRRFTGMMNAQPGMTKAKVAQEIEKSNFTDAQKIYLIQYYGITESDWG